MKRSANPNSPKGSPRTVSPPPPFARSPKGSPRIMRRLSSGGSTSSLRRSGSLAKIATSSSERSPLLIPPRIRSHNPSLYDSSTNLTGSIRSGTSVSNKQQTDDDDETCHNCPPICKCIFRIIWSKYTALLCIACSLILLGVGITNLQYQRVSAKTSSTTTSANHGKSHNYRNNITDDDSRIHNTSSATSTGASTTISSGSMFWPLSATQIVEYSDCYNTISFGEMATSIIPLWYTQTIKAINIIITSQNIHGMGSLDNTTNSNNEKHHVGSNGAGVDNDLLLFRTRKLLLHTRELLDVFSPVYDPKPPPSWMTLCSIPSTIKSPSDKHILIETDPWYIIRSFLDYGYHALKNYHQVMHDIKSRNEYGTIVMEWKHNFTSFQDKYDQSIMEYLASPAMKNNTSQDESHSYHTYVHNEESDLFWKGSKHRALLGQDLFTVGIAKLGRIQIKRIRTYLQELQLVDINGNYTTTSSSSLVWNHQMHERIKCLRKQLRLITDEQDLFEDFFIPYEQADRYMVVLKETRDLLDDIINDWTASDNDDVIMVKRPPSKEKMQHDFERQWKGFQGWIQTVDLDTVLQKILSSLDQ